MKKRITAILCILTLVLSTFTIPAMADATKVVTIGQDLTDDQEAFIINYFGVDRNTAQVIYVNNQQEREYVGSWIPLEQIGNITISSAYVQPTTSGGIQVKTANLTYVTGNMIASVLSTAGVKNCNIVAAAPFPVSGTGALTGVMIAYQVATGEELEESKRDLAVQEFTVTQQASESIGEQEALQLVNAVKMEVIQADVDPEDSDQIAEIVNNLIANVEQNISVDNSVNNIDNSTTEIYSGLSEEDRQLIVDLAQQIARQDYQYEEMKDTLERVEDNLSRETNITISIDNSGDVSVSPVVEVHNDTDVDVDASADAEAAADADAASDVTVQEEEDSILSGTNDELIDITYQSSTRDKDIAVIEEKLNEEATQTEEAASQETDDAPVFVMEEEIYYEPGQEEPVIEEPVIEEPVSEEPVIEEPVIEEPIIEEPVIEEPIIEEPVIEEPVIEEPVIEEPVIEEPVIEEPIIEEPVIEEPAEETEPVMNEEIYVEQEEQPGILPGGWTIPSIEETEGSVLPEEVQQAFDNALMNYVGMNFKPIACIGSQVVAGVNYQILCTGAPVVLNPQTGLYVVTVYKNLDGESFITNVADFDLGALEEKEKEETPDGMLSGGWAAPEEYEAAALPEDAQSAFDNAMGMLLGVNYTPAALLGTKVIAGTEYALLCHAATVTEVPATSFVVAYIAVDPDGNAQVLKIMPLNCADYTE